MGILFWAGGSKGPQPVRAGLEALYLMDEGSGQTVIDSSGNGVDGLLGSTAGAGTNDPSWTAEGLSFSTDDFVGCSGDAAMRPDAWTVCAAMRITPGVPVPLVGWSDSANFPAVYAAAPFNQNRPLVWLSSNCYRYFENAAPVDVQDGGWHFWAFSCPGNAAADIQDAALAVDGQTLAVQTSSAVTPGGLKTQCLIGAVGPTFRAEATAAFFSLHSRVLSDTEKEQMRLYAKQRLAERVVLP